MNDTRLYVLNLLKQSLSCKNAENIEKSIYNFTIQYATNREIVKSWTDSLFVHTYKFKANEILQNITSNQDLINKIEKKQILAKNVAFQAKEDSLVNQEEESEITDGLFQCRNCGSKKTTYYSLQTRSADEPMTNFITCVVCKNRWKM